MIKRPVSAVLAAAVILTSPGFSAWQAVAAEFNAPELPPSAVGAAPVVPAVPNLSSNLLPPLNVSDLVVREAGSQIQRIALENPAAVGELFKKAAQPSLDQLAHANVLVKASLLNPDRTVPQGVLGAINAMRADARYAPFVGRIDGLAGLSGKSAEDLTAKDLGPEQAAAIGERLMSDLQGALASQKAAKDEDCKSGGCPFGFDKLFGKKPAAPASRAGNAPTAQERVVAKLWKLSRVRPDAFQFLVSVARGEAKPSDKPELSAALRATGWLNDGGLAPAVSELVTNYRFVEGKSGAARVAVSPLRTPGLFRPADKAVGMSPWKYAWFTGFYVVMQFFNKQGARILSLWDNERKYNKNSWDKWPTQLGVLYLLSKLRYVRANALWNPYLYATTDTEDLGQAPEAAKISYTADGKWAASGPDGQDPQMGVPSAAGVTRWGANVPQTKAPQDAVATDPAIGRVAGLLYRMKDAAGRYVTIPGNLMNGLALWIQMQMHGFGGNTAHESIYDKPYELIASDGSKFLVERESKDPTRVTDDGGRTPVNERSLPWIQVQTYGSNDEELAALRSFKNGHLALDEAGYLPEDPKKPGIDKTGFNNNYNVPLSFQHWEAVKEHNRIADYFRYFHPDWSDDQLFYYARKTNVALMNLEHTRFWTKDLLQHPALQAGMDADGYGFLGSKRKDYLMRFIQRHPWAAKLLKPVTNNDMLWGMPGSKLELHDAPFQTAVQFRMVYRVLHSLLPEDIALLEPGTERKLATADLAALISGKTRDAVKAFGYNVITYSLAKAVAGKLDLHNFPSALTKFENQQHQLQAPGLKNASFDLAIVDILRERESWDATYNEFRKSVGEPPVTSFMELTGGRKELADELERVYGNVDAVDAYVGVLVEPKPEGFVLSYTQFYQFVLNAPRRVKGLYQMTEDRWSYANYLEGMNWINRSMLSPSDRWARNAQEAPASGLTGKTYADELKAEMEGVPRGYAPWPSAEKFPQRNLERHEADGERILGANVRSLVLGAVAVSAGAAVGALPLATAAALAGVLALPLLLGYRRLEAWRRFQKVWQAAATDARSDVFGLVYKGDQLADQSARWSRLSALAASIGAGALAWGLLSAHPVVAALLAGTALSGLGVRNATKQYEQGTELLKVSLLPRLRQGASASAGAALSASQERELEDMFQRYAPGRDYMTADDLALLREGAQWRDSQQGLGNALTRTLRRLAARRADARLMDLYADRVVTDFTGISPAFAPAISKDMMRKIYDGSARVQIQDERARPGLDVDLKAPSRGTDVPKGSLQEALSRDADAASKTMLRRLGLSVVTSALLAAATVTGHAAVLSATGIALFGLAGFLAAGRIRASALADMQDAVSRAGGPASQALYGPISRAEDAGRLAGLAAKVTAGAAALAALKIGSFAGLLLWLHGYAWVAGAIAAGAAWLAWRAIKGSSAFGESLALARVGVYEQLKAAAPARSESWPGKTALERHGRFFSDGADLVTLRGGYAQLRKTGLPVTTSFMTALLAQLTFGRKSQKNMPAEARARLKPGFFNIWTPGLVDAQADGNSRIWAHADMSNGTKHGDVDPEQFERLFAQFAEGRDYVTARDLERMRQANLDRDGASLLKRLVGNMASKRSFAQLLQVGADRVVWEGGRHGKLVPAISKKRVRALFEGEALWDIARDRGEN